MAITMDDPSVDIGPFMTWPEANRRLLDTFSQRSLKIALFVCGMRVDHSEGQKLLTDWDKAGHLICNHSYSHLNFNGPKVTYERFASDFARNEPILQPYSRRRNLFRYPALQEGDTAEKRDRFRALLKSRGYKNGYVTIDASDWYVDQRMRERLSKDSTAAMAPYRDYLIAHLLDRANFYRQLALDTLGHEIPHTLLVHYRPLEAFFLADVMTAFEKVGWEWINADQAFDDPVFLREPQTLPAGESLVWALAAESGQFKDRLRYPGEDDAYEKPKMDALGL
ncbi:MAG TPA: polysaccharide deacetylase family protein [Candidatus Acidoferrales bacterium]|nr:polysaccharide deacetylase family protein [Candidatus Acidoferrales bacterium]